MTSPPWQPGRPATIVIGMLTIWPVLYIFVFFGFIIWTFISIGMGSTKPDSPGAFLFIFPLHMLTMLLMFALITIYVVHAFRTNLIPEDRRILWVVVLLFGNLIAAPIYWYLYMWRPVATATTPTGVNHVAG